MSTTAVRHLLGGAVLDQVVHKILTSGKLGAAALGATCGRSPPNVAICVLHEKRSAECNISLAVSGQWRTDPVAAARRR